MPLEPYPRGNFWWVKGRVEYEGKSITAYYRCTTGGASREAAEAWVARETQRQRHRHILGEDRPELTMAEAMNIYDAKPADADYLLTIIDACPEIAEMLVKDVTPKWVKTLGLDLYPDAATDTVWRQVVTPLRAVINNAHEMGYGTPPIRIKAFTEKERIDRDLARGKQSRVERTPADLNWLILFRARADPYNAALAKFMFETAVRIAQAVEMKPEDLDLRNLRVWIQAAKGHPAQWVDISHEMMVELANLPPKRPMNRITGERMEPCVFGYATRSGYRKRWKTICKDAGIAYISAHSAGRHGFATHVRHTLGFDAGSAMKAGRWNTQSAFDRYDHAPDVSREIREQISTKSVHAGEIKSINPLKTGDK